MVSAHSLSKVQKNIKQKKGPKAASSIHEDSRDGQRLKRAAARDGKIAKLADVRGKRNQPLRQ